jgi:peptidoglycan LD-endopeptidase CwlK
MPLGKISLSHLDTCHPDLQSLIRDAAAGVDRGDLAYAGVNDMMVSCGWRGEADQDEAVRTGVSKTPWPTSKHNRQPSDAVDVAPYPQGWSDAVALAVLHAYIVGLAAARGMKLHGISWDAPHIERVA